MLYEIFVTFGNRHDQRPLIGQSLTICTKKLSGYQLCTNIGKQNSVSLNLLIVLDLSTDIYIFFWEFVL